jgi:hypothetical protein
LKFSKLLKVNKEFSSFDVRKMNNLNKMKQNKKWFVPLRTIGKRKTFLLYQSISSKNTNYKEAQILKDLALNKTSNKASQVVFFRKPLVWNAESILDNQLRYCSNIFNLLKLNIQPFRRATKSFNLCSLSKYNLTYKKVAVSTFALSPVSQRRAKTSLPLFFFEKFKFDLLVFVFRQTLGCLKTQRVLDNLCLPCAYLQISTAMQACLQTRQTLGNDNSLFFSKFLNLYGYFRINFYIKEDLPCVRLQGKKFLKPNIILKKLVFYYLLKLQNFLKYEVNSNFNFSILLFIIACSFNLRLTCSQSSSSKAILFKEKISFTKTLKFLLKKNFYNEKLKLNIFQLKKFLISNSFFKIQLVRSTLKKLNFIKTFQFNLNFRKKSFPLLLKDKVCYGDQNFKSKQYLARETKKFSLKIKAFLVTIFCFFLNTNFCLSLASQRKNSKTFLARNTMSMEVLKKNWNGTIFVNKNMFRNLTSQEELIAFKNLKVFKAQSNSTKLDQRCFYFQKFKFFKTQLNKQQKIKKKFFYNLHYYFYNSKKMGLSKISKKVVPINNVIFNYMKLGKLIQYSINVKNTIFHFNISEFNKLSKFFYLLILCNIKNFKFKPKLKVFSETYFSKEFLTSDKPFSYANNEFIDPNLSSNSKSLKTWLFQTTQVNFQYVFSKSPIKTPKILIIENLGTKASTKSINFFDLNFKIFSNLFTKNLEIFFFDAFFFKLLKDFKFKHSFSKISKKISVWLMFSYFFKLKTSPEIYFLKSFDFFKNEKINMLLNFKNKKKLKILPKDNIKTKLNLKLKYELLTFFYKKKKLKFYIAYFFQIFYLIKMTFLLNFQRDIFLFNKNFDFLNKFSSILLNWIKNYFIFKKFHFFPVNKSSEHLKSAGLQRVENFFYAFPLRYSGVRYDRKTKKFQSIWSIKKILNSNENRKLNFYGFLILYDCSVFNSFYCDDNFKFTFFVLKTYSFFQRFNSTIKVIFFIEIKINKHFNKKNVQIFLLPTYKSLKTHLEILKTLIKKSHTQTQLFLVSKLTSQIVSWCYFYKIISNFKVFNYCDNILIRLLWKWANRLHQNKSKKWIQKKYFLSFKQKNIYFKANQVKNNSRGQRINLFKLNLSSKKTNLMYNQKKFKKVWIFKLISKNLKFSSKIFHLPLHIQTPLLKLNLILKKNL